MCWRYREKFLFCKKYKHFCKINGKMWLGFKKIRILGVYYRKMNRMKDTIRRRIVKKELLFLLVIAMLSGASSCKKETTEPNSSNPNVLPPLTHEGKNTFGCKVNGEVWVAYAPYSISGPIALEGNYDPSTGNFLLEGTLENSSLNRLETIGIGSHNVFNPGFYNVPAEGNDYIAGFLDYKENYNCSRYYYRSVLRNE